MSVVGSLQSYYTYAWPEAEYICSAMSDLIRQNSENLELKTIPTSSKLTLLLLTVTILSDPNGLFVGADRQPGDDCSGSDGSSNQRLSYHEVKDNPGLLRCCPAIRCTAGNYNFCLIMNACKTEQHKTYPAELLILNPITVLYYANSVLIIFSMHVTYDVSLIPTNLLFTSAFLPSSIPCFPLLSSYDQPIFMSCDTTSSICMVGCENGWVIPVVWLCFWCRIVSKEWIYEGWFECKVSK